MRKWFSFSTPFAPDTMWNEWLQANRRVVVFSASIVVCSTLITLGHFINYYYTQRLYMQGLWWCVSLVVLGFFWYKARNQAMQIYHKFLTEIEQRQKNQQSIELSAAKQKVLRQFHRWTDWQWWKGIAILLSGTWAGLYIHQEWNKMNLKYPIRLSVQIKQGITHKQTQIARLTANYCDFHAHLRHHQARVVALKRMISETKQSVLEQWGNLYQGQNARAQLAQAQSQIYTNPQNPIAQQLRNNAPVFQQIKGQTEVYLFLQNRESQASDALLAKDEHLITGFQDLQQSYDKQLNHAQKSVYRDQDKLSQLEKEIKHEQRVVERLMVALRDNQILRKKLLEDIQQEFTVWLKRKSYEERLEAIRQAKTQKQGR